MEVRDVSVQVVLFSELLNTKTEVMVIMTILANDGAGFPSTTITAIRTRFLYRIKGTQS